MERNNMENLKNGALLIARTKAKGGKFMLKKTNGITLVALIITVIVMLILVGVTVSVVINSNLIGVAQNVADATEAAYENEKNLSKITIGGVTYPSLEAYTTGWDETSGVNFPKLATGMKAVYWDNAGNEIEQGEENFNWNNWFDYKAQTGTTDGESRWANAKTEDGSYWVWIPRFEYKITPTTDTTPSDTNAGTIDVRFISTDVKQGSAGYTTTNATTKTVGGTTVSENGITISSDGYIIHPAFTSNVDVGGFGKELAGFWVAKYEMSQETSTDGTTWTTVEMLTSNKDANDQTVSDSAKGNILTKNAGNANYVRAVSKPNVSSWRWIDAGNAYTNSYYYDRSKDSHLIKNSEWGAVAYLTHSKYGRNGTEVTINDNSGFVTGDGDYTTNVAQSSTGNITGIYDLSGGAYERVAAFDNTTGANISYGSSFASNGGKSTKYATAYSNSTGQYYLGQDGYSNTTFEALDNAGHKVSITGDAIKEVHVTSEKSWFNDSTYFVSYSFPFLTRGGYCMDESIAGMFCMTCGSGSSNFFYNSFRVVCAF